MKVKCGLCGKEIFSEALIEMSMGNFAQLQNVKQVYKQIDRIDGSTPAFLVGMIGGALLTHLVREHPSEVSRLLRVEK